MYLLSQNNASDLFIVKIKKFKAPINKMDKLTYYKIWNPLNVSV